MKHLTFRTTATGQSPLIATTTIIVQPSTRERNDAGTTGERETARDREARFRHERFPERHALPIIAYYLLYLRLGVQTRLSHGASSSSSQSVHNT